MSILGSRRPAPPFWWQQLPWSEPNGSPASSVIRCLTLPLSSLYGLGAAARRAFYQRGWLTVKQLPAPVVSVGNLTVGGTGKTPVTAALARSLRSQGLKVVILSRGYGGYSRKWLCLSDGRRLYHRPPQVGDEPYWLARTLPDVPVYTGTFRYQTGLAAWQAHRPDIFLLDDGFQHFQLHRHLDIVLLDAEAPYGNGRLLPAGPLREHPRTLALAQVLVLTRFAPDRHQHLLQTLSQSYPHKLVLTAQIVPTRARLEPAGQEGAPQLLKEQALFAFAGLARPAVFARTLAELKVDLTGFQPFPDHYAFTAAKLHKLAAAARASGAQALITTAKDWARLGERWSESLPLWVLEVEARLTPEQPLINRLVRLVTQSGLNPALNGLFVDSPLHDPPVPGATPPAPTASPKPIKSFSFPTYSEFSPQNSEHFRAVNNWPEVLPLPPAVRERFGWLKFVGRPLPPPEAIRRILLRAPNWLGDAVMSLPVLAGLKKFFPQAEITVLAAPRVVPLFAAIPSVAAIALSPTRYNRGKNSWRYFLDDDSRLTAHGVKPDRYPAENFDLAVILPNSFESALSLFLARIPHRLGYAADVRRLLLSRAVKGRHLLAGHHLVYYYLGVLADLGEVAAFSPPRLFLTAEEQEAAGTSAAEIKGPDGGPLVGLSPGAAFGPAKRWPPARFAAVGQALQKEFQARLVLLGAPPELPAAQAVSEGLGAKVHNLVGRTSLRQALQVLSVLQLLITNDSGLMHAAAALGTPVVALFGSTNPQVTGPFSPRATVLHHPLPCSPCLQRTCAAGRDYECLRSITVAEVVAAARPWLA